MKTLDKIFPLMEEASSAEGEGGGAATPNNPTPTTGDESVLGGEDTTQDVATEPTKEAPNTEPAKTTDNLLDDDQPAEKVDEPKVTEAPTVEQIEEWAKGIKALDMGDGVKWSDDLLKGMAPALMGLPKDAQEKAIKAYADIQTKQARTFAENMDAANKTRIKLCKERFGDDLSKVAGLAKKAGARIFEKHPNIWKALKGTPEFANDPDVIECLAEMGRMFAEDTGRVVPKDGTGGGDQGDVFHRMYGNVKV